MSHLTPETIARLVDEGPSAAEAAHLEMCAECRAELDGMRDDVSALSLLPDMAEAPDQWAELEGRLAAEGLIRRRRLVSPARLTWAAAALVVFMAGGVAGRMSAAPQQLAVMPTAAPATASATGTTGAASARGVQAGGSGDVTRVAGDAGAASTPSYGSLDACATPGPQPQRPGTLTPAPRPAGSTRLASAPAAAPALPRTLDDAAALLRQAEAVYLAALTHYAELSAGGDAGDPVARLAALQSIVMTTQAALTQAPADPVINGYHLTALAQRDATLRQVASATTDRWY
jgi:hypothetical protein